MESERHEDAWWPGLLLGAAPFAIFALLELLLGAVGR